MAIFSRSKTSVKIGEKEYTVELAENSFTRGWGLSLRSEGKMLFDFSRPTRAVVDMMLLSKPLNLYFLDSGKKVIDVQEAEPWTLDPRTWKTYSPGRRYRYLLESFEDLGLEEGDELEFEL